MNLNMTLAWSLLFIPLTGKMPSMTAVCLMLPMWTVVLNPGTISVGWKRTQTLALGDKNHQQITTYLAASHLEVLTRDGLNALGADGHHATPQLGQGNVQGERGALLGAHQATRSLVPPDAGHLGSECNND